jgi:hypothetical protein
MTALNLHEHNCYFKSFILMKNVRIYLLVLLTILSFGTSKAQKVPDKTLEGYVVGVTGFAGVKKTDSLKGFITVYNPLGRQIRAVYYENMSNVRTKKAFGPARARGYFTDDKFYEAVAFPDEKDVTPQSFAEVMKKGKLNMYRWYVIALHSEKQNPRKPEDPYQDKELDKDILLKKTNGPVVDINTYKFRNFKKDVSEYLKEDKELAAKIASGELGRDKIEQIVDMYNEWAVSKKKR